MLLVSASCSPLKIAGCLEVDESQIPHAQAKVPGSFCVADQIASAFPVTILGGNLENLGLPPVLSLQALHSQLDLSPVGCFYLLEVLQEEAERRVHLAGCGTKSYHIRLPSHLELTAAYNKP